MSIATDALRPRFVTCRSENGDWSRVSASDGRVIFRNHQWVVSVDGMDTDDDRYWIDADRLTERSLSDKRLYSWPLHLAGKVWVDLSAFCEAYSFAMRILAPEHDAKALQASIDAAREKKIKAAEFNKFLDDKYPRGGLGYRSISAEDLCSAGQEFDAMLAAREAK